MQKKAVIILNHNQELFIVSYSIDNCNRFLLFLQTCLTIATAIVSANKLQMKNENDAHRIQRKKMERKVFVTVTIMQLGFTVTISKNIYFCVLCLLICCHLYCSFWRSGFSGCSDFAIRSAVMAKNIINNFKNYDQKLNYIN